MSIAGNPKSLRSASILFCGVLTLVFSSSSPASPDPPLQDHVVFKTQKEGLFSNISFDLKKIISIGDDSRPNYSFFRIRDIAVDTEGYLYVLELGNFRIQKFDEHGKYVGTIGRQGQGPGDLEWPTRLWIDQFSRQLYVKSTTCLDVFSVDGEFIRRLQFRKLIRSFAFAGKSDFFVIISGNSENATMNNLYLTDTNGNITRNIVSSPDGTMFRLGGKQVFSSSGHEIEAFVSVIDNDNIVYGFSGEYELKIYGTDGNLKRVIKRNDPTPEFTPEEISLMDKRFIPKVKPYFYGLLVDSEKRIYVQTNLQVPQWESYADRTLICDVFHFDGHYLGRIELPPNTRIIKDSKLYAFSSDDDFGLEKVDIYSIGNWDSFNDSVQQALRK